MLDLQTDIPFILTLISTIVLLGYILYLNHKIERLLGGGLGTTLPETIDHLKKQADEQDIFRSGMTDYLKDAEKRILRSTQAVGLTRFTPFKDGGSGGQSFAAAFIDERGNGLVLSSLYVRDRVSVYAKELKGFNSTFELTAEEKESIQKAKNSLPLSNFNKK